MNWVNAQACFQGVERCDKGGPSAKEAEGEGMFKLTLLFSMLHSNRISLCAGNGSFAAVFTLPGLLPSPASLQVATTPSELSHLYDPCTAITLTSSSRPSITKNGSNKKHWRTATVY